MPIFPDLSLPIQPLQRSGFLLYKDPRCREGPAAHSSCVTAEHRLRLPEKVLQGCAAWLPAISGYSVIPDLSKLFSAFLVLGSCTSLSSKLFWILGHEGDFFCDVYNVTENERIFCRQTTNLISCDLSFDLFLTYLSSILFIFESHTPGLDWAVSKFFPFFFFF